MMTTKKKSSAMEEEYNAAVKRMKQEYDSACAQQMEIVNNNTHSIDSEPKEELPCIRFDLPQARHIVHLIREQLRKDENSGLIDYKYLPDKNGDKLSLDCYYGRNQIGGFYIIDMYGNILHMVNLY